MNVTLLSFISQSLISASPLYVGNQMRVKTCDFKKFTCILFFNQQKLFLQNTNFHRGLNGVIKIDSEFTQETHYDPIHQEYFINKYTNHEFNGFQKLDAHTRKESYVFSQCTFTNINSDNENLLYVNGNSVSVYMSEITIFNCGTIQNKNVIRLDCRCNTITHICGYQNYAKDAADLLFIDAKKDDFFVLMYTTFVGHEEKIENKHSYYAIFAKYGYQYHRCLNFSNIIWIDGNSDARPVIQAEAPRCFSFNFITFENVNRPMLAFTGSIRIAVDIDDHEQNITFSCSMISACVNMYYNFFRFDMNEGKHFFLNLDNCHFSSSAADARYMFILLNNYQNMHFHIHFENCILSKNLNIKKSDNSPLSFEYNENGITTEDNVKPLVIAHYTNHKCLGKSHDDEPTLAYGCKVDNCLASEQCNKTIGFPSEVAPYETIVFDGFQPSPTEDFTSSISFSFSTAFTKSGAFTESSDFTKSDNFKPTSHFTFSNYFTETSGFSETTKFTKSSAFSFSKQFTKSDVFDPTDDFTKSSIFSKTTHFTKSSFFSETEDFSKSSIFSETDNFSKSSKFTDTSDFTKSLFFSKTGNFSKSSFFSETEDFTKSILFTESRKFSYSLYFSESSGFSGTQKFSSSKIFSDTNEFTKTGEFSETTYFTESIGFSPSKSFDPTAHWDRTHFFTPSNKFSKSSEFTNSFYFSNSGEFTNSVEFTHTIGFSKTDGFTKTDEFSKSKEFTESDDFEKTNKFTKSIDFSKSDIFTRSNYFSKTKEFSNTGEFTDSNKFSCSFTFSSSDLPKLSTQSSFFSRSIEFSQSETFIQKSAVIIDIKQDESKNISTGVKVGIALTAAAVVAGIIILSIFLLRRRRMVRSSDFGDANLEILDETDNSFVTQNPLRELMTDDDPFEDEFNFHDNY